MAKRNLWKDDERISKPTSLAKEPEPVYVKPEGENLAVIANCERVNFRVEPNKESQSRAIIHNGRVVKIVRVYDGTWSYVCTIDGELISGYVMTRYLQEI